MTETISTTEAAKLLDVCNRSYIARLLRQGKLDGEKIDTPRGAVWRVYLESVEAYASDRPPVGKPTKKDSDE